MDGATPLGTATLAGSGNTQTATFAINTLAVGAHGITAAYAGDANNAASSSTGLTQTINKVNTTSAMTSSAGAPASGLGVPSCPEWEKGAAAWAGR
jgi:hypothetical protein